MQLALHRQLPTSPNGLYLLRRLGLNGQLLSPRLQAVTALVVTVHGKQTRLANYETKLSFSVHQFVPVNRNVRRSRKAWAAESGVLQLCSF